MATAEVSFAETGILDLALADAKGRSVPVQILSAERYPAGGIKRATILFVAQRVPAMGYAVYQALPRSETVGDAHSSGQRAHLGPGPPAWVPGE